MTVFQALILGVIQGLTELLPVSSSAHLLLIPKIFNWNIPESFDVALHLGTLFAITIFFFKDWIQLIKSGFNQVIRKKKTTEGKIFWYIVAVTIPAGILSLILNYISDEICDKFQIELILIAIALIVLGIVLYVVDKRSESKIKLENMTVKQAFLIGISQAVAAAFPGTSRSGITMTVARALKIERESAAKYSFLLSTPIILAAVLVSINQFKFTIEFWAGVLSSFIIGLLVIKFLLEYLKKGSYKWFAIYRIAIGMLVLIYAFCR